MSSINLIADFYLYCKPYSHVSFDLFDTLICRRFLKVNEVHDMVSAYALSLVGRRHDSSPFDMTLLRYRMSDALKSFDGKGTQEPFVHQVWDRILTQHVPDPATREPIVAKVVDFEISIELDNLGLIEGARELLLRLRADGKIVTAISDMYFDIVAMRRILRKLDILDLFDHLYVSADSGLTKQTGDLFRKVLNDLGLHPSQMLHVGDNRHSDIAMATEIGLASILVEQPHLLEIERVAYGRRPRIEQEVADLVKVHLASILFDAVDRQLDHLYFLARDGCAINEFLDAWHHPLVDRFLPAPPHSDLYINRILACWGGIDFSGDWLVQAIGLVFWLNHGEASPEEMCTRLAVETILPVLGPEMLRAGRDTIRVADAVLKAGLKPAVKAKILANRALLIRHLHEIDFFAHRRVAVSDVGYSGTVLRDLNSLFVDEAGLDGSFDPPTMYLHLIATNEHYASNRSRSYPYARLSPQVVLPSEQLPEDLRASYAWLEFFFKHRTLKSILRFVEHDGHLQPELRHDAPNGKPIPTERVLMFAQPQEEDIVLLWMAAVNYHAPLIGPVISRFESPDAETIAQMQDEVFELHSVLGDRRSIILRVPGGRDEAIALAAREGDYWIPGSVVASRAAGEMSVPTTASTRRNPGGRILRLLRGKRVIDDVPPMESARNFDAKFYRDFYPDLRQFRTDLALWQHYFVHGKREGRFTNHEALMAQLVAECGSVPEDFNPVGYLRLNPDLAEHIDTPERALDHYMRLGRREGRSYSHAHHDLGDEFDRLVAHGMIALSDDEERQRRKGALVLDIFLRRHGVRKGPWIDEIDVAEFRALHSRWAGAVQNKAECIMALLEKGLEHGPALSMHCVFDPDFYRSQLKLGIDQTDVELYRHYLSQGSQRGLQPSEATALQHIWGFSRFPNGFDWQAFAIHAELPTSIASRAEVLRQFVETPGLDRLKFVSGAAASGLVTFLASRAWHMHGRLDEARKLYEAALALSGNPGPIHHQLGDLALQTGQRGAALRHFRMGIETTSADRWSFINLANLSIEQGDYASALSILEACKEQWQQRAPWRAVWDRALHVRSRAVLRDIVLQDAGQAALATADALFQAIADTLPITSGLAAADGGVLLLTMRAASSARRDRDLTDRVTVHDLLALEQGDYLAALLAHDTVIFHEVPFTSEVLRAIALARGLGKRTVAWSGDLVQWEGLSLAHCEWNEAGANPSPLGWDQFVDLLLPARYCDQVVTTLAGCMPFLEKIAPQTDICLLLAKTPAPDGIVHERRFVLVMPLRDLPPIDVQHVARALRSAIAADPQLHVLVDARLSETRELQEVVERWDTLGEDPSLPVLAKTIGTCDAVVQVLATASSRFAAWAEAEARGIPAILLQPSPGLKDDGLQRGEAGVRMGTQLMPVSAREHVAASIVAAANGPQGSLATGPFVARSPSAKSSTPPHGASKPRVLFANVFFAPQVIGGATRVLKDNVDYNLDHHRNAFDFAVFCGDEQNDRSGEWRIDAYRGIPVFRMATPQELNMDWRAANDMVGARFAAVLRAFQPDLVHIHCLQRLGVVLAEICREMQIPYVVTLHDAWWLSDYPFLTDEDGRQIAVEKDYRNQERLPGVAPETSLLRSGRLRQALLHAHERLAVSESFAELYRNCGISARVVENGSSRITALPRSSLQDHRVHLCHVGGLEHHKGAYLIEAALRTNTYENLHLTIVDLARGSGEETQVIWGSTPVTITGKMSTVELAGFYARMHVLLAPSTWPESYGLVTREALAHGLWVVASDLGAIGDPILEGCNGFVVPVSDAQGVAGVLRIIDRTPDTYRSSPHQVHALRHADEQSAELIGLYQSILTPASMEPTGLEVPSI